MSLKEGGDKQSLGNEDNVPLGHFRKLCVETRACSQEGVPGHPILCLSLKALLAFEIQRAPQGPTWLILPLPPLTLGTHLEPQGSRTPGSLNLRRCEMPAAQNSFSNHPNRPLLNYTPCDR